ncbi:hypothetical protein WJX81_004168 [Elliptochloris bilobata]|uniref:CSD domain-containing protein n=1 Tax=Elliptochloris bilobata TaxID=381761 RepID=A0AAW1S2J1_9CHLO
MHRQPGAPRVGPTGPSAGPPAAGVAGTGFVASIKDTFGFIQSADFDAQVFFHASEVQTLDVEGAEPQLSGAEALQQLAQGDEVAFVAWPPPAPGAKWVAKQVKRLPKGTLEAAGGAQEGVRLRGVVQRELRGGSSASSQWGLKAEKAQALRLGDPVQFVLMPGGPGRRPRATQVARVEPVVHREQGFVVLLKPEARYGFIALASGEGQVFFHQSEAPAGGGGAALGDALSFCVRPDPRSGKPIAVALRRLEPGELEAELRLPDRVQGRVLKPPGQPRSVAEIVAPAAAAAVAAEAAPGAAGALAYIDAGGKERRASFAAEEALQAEPGAAGGGAQTSTLGPGDDVEFTVVVDRRTGGVRAEDVRLIRRAAERRELGQVKALRPAAGGGGGGFGFIRACERAGDVFFHLSALSGCDAGELAIGDDVEFSIAREPARGLVAPVVTKAAKGSAVFEEVGEEELSGVAAAAAAKLGGVAARVAGRRAVQVSPRALTGTVVTYKGSFGFVEYVRGDERPRVYFTAGDAEQHLAPPLRPGDEVAFTLAVKPATLGQNPKPGFSGGGGGGGGGGRDVIARRVRRTREAPAGKENAEGVHFVSERNPAAQKFTGNLDARAPLAGQAGASKARLVPALVKTGSGTLLNPTASEFVPRSFSGGSLMSMGSGTDGVAAERPAAPSRLGVSSGGQPVAAGAASQPEGDARAV